MQVTSSFSIVLLHFQCVFTAPSFVIFVDLMTGWLLSHRHRYITDLILTSGSVGNGHHSRYHNFFSKSSWMLGAVSELLARLLVDWFVSTGVIELAIDDTLCRKRGLTVYGTGMHHDPLISSRAMKLVSWGHDWVVLCLVVRCPFWAPTKVWSLPICCRLYRNRQGVTKGKKARRNKVNQNHRTRPQLAAEMIQMVAGWFADRTICLTGDSAYGGRSILGELPDHVHLISHVHPKGVLYEPAPPRQPGQKGAARKKGARMPGMAAWAKDRTQPWKKLRFDQFGLHATLWVKTKTALYYRAGKDRLLKIVVVRDATGKRPDQMFYCTCLTWGARKILSTYAGRWSIEVTFENCKQLLGFEDPANRTPKAVGRTAPMALVLYSLIVAWFHHSGHRHVKFPTRPWYTKKAEPSFADMLTTVRRLSCQEILRPLLPRSGRIRKSSVQMIEILSLSG